MRAGKMNKPFFLILTLITAAAIASAEGCASNSAPNNADEDANEIENSNDAETKEYPLIFSTPLRAEGRWIKDANGNKVVLKGVNWSGGEQPEMTMQGLDKSDVRDVARAIKKLGFNSVRLVWANELVEKNPVIAAEKLAANPSLVGKTAMEVMDAAVEALALEGLLIIMNNHNSDAIGCCQVGDGNDLWYNDRYPEEAWIADWKFIAKRYRDNPAVIGADLRNELRKFADWGQTTFGPEYDWASAAEKGGEAVLAEAPHWLIIVEGLGFGRNLVGAAERPIVLTVSGRLVYSSHDYPWSQREGIDASVGDYEELKNNLDKIWGFLLEEGKPYTAPVWLGEFGTCNTCWNQGKDDEKVWFQSITRYLKENQVSWSWWSLINGDSWGLINPETGEPYSPELVEALMKQTAPDIK